MMRVRIRRNAAALLCCAALISAQEQTTPVPPVRQFRLPPRIGVFAEVRLSLQEALAMGMANNNDIDASKIDQQISNYTLAGARGAFDPTFSVSSGWQQNLQPVATALGGTASGAVLNKMWQADPTVSGALPWWGGSYRLDLNSQRSYTNNSFVTLNPQYPSSLNFQFTQPLYRGFRYDNNRRTLEVAKKNRSLTGEQFRQRVMQVVQQTEQGYWELVFAYNNLQVQLEAVEIARQQDESNRRQEAQGLLAPIDVVASQTQLANFELGAYTAQTLLTRAENSLKTLILADRGSPMWASAIIPTSQPEVMPRITPLADAVSEALANRPEAAAVRINAEINQSDIKLFREQTKPQVDVVATYTRAGLAGLQIPQSTNAFTAGFIPLVERLNVLSASAGLDPINFGGFGGGNAISPVLVGSYGQSLTNLWAGNFPTTQVQLRVSLPLRNRTAEANLGRSLADGRRFQNQREQIEQAIEADVRNSMQQVQSSQLRLDAARLQRRSAEEQYNSEQRQFRAGTSTLFLVQQRQSAMITSRSQERRAESDLGQAIAAFELATGTILREHAINLQ